MRSFATIIIGMAFAIPMICSGQEAPDTLWTTKIDSSGKFLQFIKTRDGGYATSSTDISDRDDYYRHFQVIKFDTSGQIDWRTYMIGGVNDTPIHSFSYTIAQLHNGNYMFFGQVNHQFTIGCVSEEGDSLWLRMHDREDFRFSYNLSDCVVSPDSNVILASNKHIAKISYESGDIIWKHIIDNGRTVFQVARSENGGYLAVGYTGLYTNKYAIRLTEDGEVMWERIYNLTHTFADLTATRDGGWCLTGLRRTEVRDQPDLIRLNDDGDIIWYNYYDVEFNGSHVNLVETADGGFTIFGKIHGRYSLHRVDSRGETHWQRVYFERGPFPYPYSAYIFSGIILLENNSYLIGGAETGGKAFLARTTPETVEVDMEFALPDTIDFGSVYADTVATTEIIITNPGRRLNEMSVSGIKNGSDVFFSDSSDLNLLYPWDTLRVPIDFVPTVDVDSVYWGVLELVLGEETHEIVLTGKVVSLSAPIGNDLFPTVFSIHPLFPNPFNSSTQIRFDLPTASEVKLSVFDINGRLLTNLVNGTVSAGSHAITWDASGFATGIYFVKMELGVGRGRPTPHSKGDGLETSWNNASDDSYYKRNNGYYKQFVQKAVVLK